MKSLFTILFLFIASGIFLSATAQEPETKEAFLTLSPDEGTYEMNEEFEVQLILSSPDPVTSARIYITFDPKMLSILNIEQAVNAFPFWWEHESEDGLIKLQASVPWPGIQGESTVATLRAKVIGEAGPAILSYDPSSLILTSTDADILDLASSRGAQFNFIAQASAPSEGSPSGPDDVFYTGVGVLILLGVIIFIIREKKLTS